MSSSLTEVRLEQVTEANGETVVALVGNTCGGEAAVITSYSIHYTKLYDGDAQEQQALQEEIVQVLADIRASVEDFAAMRERIATAINDLAALPAADTPEISDFLRWTSSENFVFLGYAHYAVSGDELARTPDGGLGLLRHANHPRFGHCRAGIPSKLARNNFV